jgi:hypothetical protein
MVVAGMLALTPPAAARPGFSIGVGVGRISVGGGSVRLADLQPDAGTPEVGQIGYVPTTEMSSGFSPMLQISFNFLGYAAIELVASGQPPLSDEWSGLVHGGIRVYPLWHWQNRLPANLRPLEPSLFVGWGTAWQGYSPDGTEDVAWRSWKSPRFGVGLEYFVRPRFKLGLSYFWVRAAHDQFLFDRNKSWTYAVDPPAVVTFNQLYVTASFHYGPSRGRN